MGEGRVVSRPAPKIVRLQWWRESYGSSVEFRWAGVLGTMLPSRPGVQRRGSHGTNTWGTLRSFRGTLG